MISKTVLVTGGAGFIGSHLCERLLQDGHYVICLDNYFTGSKDNVLHLLENPKFELIRHDVIVPITLEVDWIFNLACPASPLHYQRYPIKTIETNVLGAMNMLHMAERVGVRILQASTSEVYGDPTVHPQTEDYWGNVNPIGKRSCYDEGKRVAETLFFDHHRSNNVDIRIARIFNTYGTRMMPNDGRVVSNFIVQALKGKDLTIYGDGSHTRSFCYVSDTVAGLIRLMETGGITGPINIGNPTEITVLELANMIIRLCESKSKVSFTILPKDDPKTRCPDITAAHIFLGWKPTVNLEDGLIRTIHYFKNRL